MFLQQKITNISLLKENSFPVFNIIKLISQWVTVTTDLSLYNMQQNAVECYWWCVQGWQKMALHKNLII